MCAPSAPAAPDPTATAAAQAAANKEAAVSQANINMVNQYTPQGSLEYTQRGTAADGTPQYSATQTYSPEQQKLYDLTNQAAQKYGQTANSQLNTVASTLSKPLDYSSLGAAPTADAATRQAAADALYGRLNPQLDREKAALETRLANQGITMGSDAWNKGMDDYSRQANDARLAVDSQAGQEEANQYNMALAARNQAINEMNTQRSVPLNELAAMLSGSQVQNPNFTNTPQQQINPADVQGATYASYNGQLQANQTKQAANAATTSGLASLAGSGAMLGAAAIF